MTATQGDVPFAVVTYRYLRLAIVVVLSALLASVMIERANAGCWQGSLSAYYYTPVQTVFVGALIAIGVAFVAIEGATPLEDALLNVAGVVAPIVAVVPTSRPQDNCSSTAGLEQRGGATMSADELQLAFIDNNVVALVIAGVVAVTIGWIAARRSATGTVPAIDRSGVAGLAFAVVLLVTGSVWYGFFRDSFVERAHGVAAIVLFAALFATMVVNSRISSPGFRPLYVATAATMAATAVVVVVAGLLVDEWRHQILLLELFQLVPVTVYWAVQTLEHWNGGAGTQLTMTPPTNGSPYSG